MKKILFVSDYYSKYISAGTSQRTKDIKKGLSLLGWECKVLTIERKKYPISNEPDNNDIFCTYPLFDRYPLPFIEIKKLFKLVINTDIVHLIGHWSMLQILIIVLCILSKKPYIFSPCGATEPIGRNILIKKIFNFLYIKFIVKNAAFIFAVTNKEKKELSLLTKSPLKIEVFPNGIWGEIYENEEKPEYKKFNFPNKYILYVGRISYIKGPDILLEAFLNLKNSSDLSLVYAGPDEYMKDRITKKLKSYPDIKNIYFLGSINNKERDFLMRNAIITIIPSRKEAMSMVALETSIQGTPFLASQNCGLEDFIDNFAGYSCEAEPLLMSKKIENILSNPSRIELVGKNAKAYVLKNYTWDKIINKMSLLMLSLLKK